MTLKRIVFLALSTAISSVSVLHAGKSTDPLPRNQEFSWMSMADWYHQHADDVEVAAKGKAEVLFVGDSITAGWQWSPAWKENIEPLKPANFAIGGDKTQNLLWRLQNGGVGKLNPKAIVMLIGVNNFGHDNATPEEVFEGISANLKFLRTSFPNAKVLTLSVFPWGEKADDPNRDKGKAVNAMVGTLASDSVKVMDIGGVFLKEDGSISKEIMADFLHPTPAGYERATSAILPTLTEWLKDEGQAH